MQFKVILNPRKVLIEAPVATGRVLRVLLSTQSTPHPRARITPAGKSPCEVARELRDPTLRADPEVPASDPRSPRAGGAAARACHSVHAPQLPLRLLLIPDFSDDLPWETAHFPIRPGWLLTPVAPWYVVQS